MTKIKAFLVCFFSPIVALGALSLVVRISNPGEDLSYETIIWGVLIFLFILMPILFFGPALTLKKEFRTYGYYGAFTGFFVVFLIGKIIGVLM
ncbi:MAG TPA: hypothetical protein DCS23_03155 [Candidatus Yonathbacteria bacterium]|nr:hypothetical protein [Candidatus Yonathbacteria bacterium]